MLTALSNRTDTALLPPVKALIPQQLLRIPQDAIQGRSQFVAHFGKENRLGITGILCLLTSCHKMLFPPFKFINTPAKRIPQTV